MAKILEIDLSKEDYLEIARKAAAEGRVENAIVNLKKALEMDRKYLKASMALCDIYNSINALEYADHVLFEALCESANQAAETELYNQLAYNHINVKDFRTAEYYIMRCDGEFVFPDNGYIPEDYESHGNGYTLYDKNGTEENSQLITKAYEALRARETSDVLLLCDRIPETSELKAEADNLVLIALMLKNDFEAVIDNANRIISLRGETLPVLASLATAYWITENKEKAYSVIDHILEKQYETEEDIMRILPLLINAEMHVNVVQYTRQALAINPFNKDIMMWLAEGLYNIGQIKESRRTFLSIVNIYNDAGAKFFLKTIDTKPEYLPYTTSIPAGEKVRRLKVLQDVVKSPLRKIKAMSSTAEIVELIDWIMTEDNPSYIRAVEVIVRNLPVNIKGPIVRKHLIDTDVTFDKLIALIADLIEDYVFKYNFDVVTQCRFKRIDLKLPDTFFVMPDILRTAYMVALSEIIEADEDASEYAMELTEGLDKVLKVEDGDIAPKYCSKLQLSRIKNTETLVGVLIAHAYKEDTDAFGVHEEGDFASKHGLDKKKFDKYYTMIFGDKYEY